MGLSLSRDLLTMSTILTLRASGSIGTRASFEVVLIQKLSTMVNALKSNLVVCRGTGFCLVKVAFNLGHGKEQLCTAFESKSYNVDAESFNLSYFSSYSY